MAIEIPWATVYPISLRGECLKLLRQCGVVVDDLNIEFLNDIPAIPSKLQLGAAPAIALGSFAYLILQIAKRRGILDEDILNDPYAYANVDIKGAELSLLGVLAAKVNGQGIYSGFLGPRALYHYKKYSMLESFKYMKVLKTKDNKWIHTHGNFQADKIKSVLGPVGFMRPIKKAVNNWQSEQLELTLAKAGATGALFRSPQEWIETEHGKSLLATPTIEIHKISEGSPCSLPSAGDQPLSGLRVLDLTRVLAGPATARLLSEQGAECLKVTSPNLPYYPFFAKVENMGKRSASVDLHDAKQKKKLEALASNCDIFISSYRAGALSSFGFSPAEIAEKSSNGVIYLSISCYGSGPWESRPGFDSLAQAATGFSIAHTFSSKSEYQEGEGRPRFAQMSAPNDYITAYLGVTGVLAALMRRAQEGGSYHVKVSLAQSAMWTMGLGYREYSEDSIDKGTSAGWLSRFGGMLKDVFPDNLILNEARSYLRKEDSPFGQINLIETPINYNNVKLYPKYTFPSVPFGFHRPQWRSPVT